MSRVGENTETGVHVAPKAVVERYAMSMALSRFCTVWLVKE